MQNLDNFTDKPKVKGLNSKLFYLVIGVICLVGGVLLILAIINNPLRNDSFSDSFMNSGSNKQKTQPIKISDSDDDLLKSLDLEPKMIASQPSKSDASASKNDTVPPITTSKKYSSLMLNNQTPVDDYQSQVNEMEKQAKLQRLKNKLAAYSSKTLIKSYSNKNAASTAVGQINTKNNASQAEGSASSSLNAKSQIIYPKSPYILNAGTLIPCVMISGLNSELSGTVKALVTENVYDSVNGKFLIIPQGSSLIGNYSNKISFGSNRIGVGFNSLIMPNGTSFDLKGLPGSDLQGFNGFTDIVDNHYWQLFGTSFIIGVITAGMQYSQNNTNPYVQTGGLGYDSNPTVGQTVAGSLGQQLGQTGLAVANKQLNVSPTIIIRQGMRFNVMLEASLDLPPYSTN